MIGRESELQGMRRGLAAAARGTCTVRMVAGGHGVGKTRLLQATCDLAAAQGFVVIRATAFQSDVNVPYSVVSDALGPLIGGLEPGAVRTLTRGADVELAHIIPALGMPGSRASLPTDSGDLTPRLRWHTAQFLTRLSQQKPLLFTVDNAHWTDPSSVALLRVSESGLNLGSRKSASHATRPSLDTRECEEGRAGLLEPFLFATFRPAADSQDCRTGWRVKQQSYQAQP